MTKSQSPAKYTGDIAEQHAEAGSGYTDAIQEISCSGEQHSIWADLFAGIHKSHILEHIFREYIDGLKLLALDPMKIPTVAYLNSQITPRSGWRIERTVVRYTMAD